MKSLITALFLLIPISSFAIVNEFNFDFGYDRQIYGSTRQNSLITRAYSAGLATYIFDYTAIDLNASKSEDITTENERYRVATNVDLVGQQNVVNSTVYGIGIKQMFAPRSARLIPALSVGYAKQFTENSTSLTVEDVVSKVRVVLNNAVAKQRVDSMFGTFSLQLRLTERLSLRGSVKTLFPAFETDKAKNNLKYAIGLSWIF
jgi:hypothetical protein